MGHQYMQGFQRWKPISVGVFRNVFQLYLLSWCKYGAVAEIDPKLSWITSRKDFLGQQTHNHHDYKIYQKHKKKPLQAWFQGGDLQMIKYTHRPDANP